MSTGRRKGRINYGGAILHVAPKYAGSSDRVAGFSQALRATLAPRFRQQELFFGSADRLQLQAWTSCSELAA